MRYLKSRLSNLPHALKILIPILIPLLFIGCSLVGLSLGDGSPEFSTTVDESSKVVQPSLDAVAIPSDIFSEQDVLINLYERANPSVVNLTIYQLQEDILIPVSQGSGFVYDISGNIITNAHVVDTAAEIDITFSDGTIMTGNIIGQDPHSDLAVVSADQLPEGVTPLPLGDMNDLEVGQTVIAIGNPFGLEGTLTQGIISALGRTIPALTSFSIPQAIQTDAAINPGNSGGPLLDLEGNVVGVNAQIETNGASRSNSGVGFAIPVSVVKRVIPELIDEGKFTWTWLGVQGGDFTPSLAEAMSLTETRGAYIAAIFPGSPADNVDLRGARDEVIVDGRRLIVGGDVIIAIDGQPVQSFGDLILYVALNTEPGQEVKLTILRANKTELITVRLDSRPQNLTNALTP